MFEEVGAHEFRNHFGHFMERASKGAEVLVRRRGKPYARLCPPDLPRRYPVFDCCAEDGGTTRSRKASSRRS